MSTDQINVRIDSKIKAQAEAVLSKIGVAPSDVIRMLYHQVIMRQGLPFVPRIETPQAKGVTKNVTKIGKAIKKSVAKNKVALADLTGR